MLIAPVNYETLRLLTAWQRAEGGTAQYNPLNTTYPMPWSTIYNPIGVRNYPTPVEGICATASTIAHEPAYLDLWKSLQNGSHTAEELVELNSVALAHWGTDPHLILRVLKTV
jgi:hypothetical protein